MYIKEFLIENIRAIHQFKLTFEEGKEAGWHVVIGDNGAGKTTVLRAIALALIGPTEILRLDPDWNKWLQKDQQKGLINMKVIQYPEDQSSENGDNGVKAQDIHTISVELSLEKAENDGINLVNVSGNSTGNSDKYFWGIGSGWFSASFGAFRRFTGGNSVLEGHYLRNPKIGAHLSLFQEDAALTESIIWLKDVYLRKLENKPSFDKLLNTVIALINTDGLLPTGVRLLEMSADGPIFQSPNGSKLHLYDLSEGIKSILSLIFELLRLLSQNNEDFSLNELGQIDARGVVLIDEVDAHLHPTWQTRIGHWFTQHFPHLQFIVATHSPLICRAAERGSIWRLATPGSDRPSGQVTGIERDRLIYGNILDAYGTEVFGAEPVRSERANEQLTRLGRLNKLAAFGKISIEEEQERQQLQMIFATDDSIN